jgi:hypothetical protein
MWMGNVMSSMSIGIDRYISKVLRCFALPCLVLHTLP